MKGLSCTDTAKVPIRSPDCTEIHPKMFVCMCVQRKHRILFIAHL